jgi:hypothetical protein
MKCNYCGKDIKFKKGYRGKNGKAVPLDVATNKRHQCEGKNAFKWRALRQKRFLAEFL